MLATVADGVWAGGSAPPAPEYVHHMQTQEAWQSAKPSVGQLGQSQASAQAKGQRIGSSCNGSARAFLF